MDKRQVREYRERYQAVAAIEAQEQRSATIELRWRQLNAILRLAFGLELSITNTDDETVVYQRWAKLKRQLL